MSRYQVPFYLAALVFGGGVGLLFPAVARPAELAVTPVLGLLLYATGSVRSRTAGGGDPDPR